MIRCGERVYVNFRGLGQVVALWYITYPHAKVQRCLVMMDSGGTRYEDGDKLLAVTVE